MHILTLIDDWSKGLKKKPNFEPPYYKNGSPELSCRLCRKAEETQTHILEECEKIHCDDAIKVPKHQLFDEDTDTLRHVSKNLEMITDKLGELGC